MPKQALPGKRRDSFSMNPFDIVLVGVDTEDGYGAPYWDARVTMPLRENIIKTMQEIGVKKPCIVTKLVFEKGKKVFGKALAEATEFPVMLDGHRRGLHAREATRRMRADGAPASFYVALPCLPPERGINMTTAMKIKRILNAHHEESTPIVKAYEFKQLMDLVQDEEAVAQYMDCGVAHVRETIKLIDTTPTLFDALKNGALPASSGMQLASLPKTRQDEVTKLVLDSGNTSPAAVRGVVRNAKKKIKQDKKEREQREKRQGKKKGRPKSPLQLDKSVVLEGVPPEKRLVRKIVEDIKQMRADDDQLNKTTAMELDIVRWTVEWLYDGAPPPPCTVTSGLVKKHKDGKRSKKKPELVGA